MDGPLTVPPAVIPVVKPTVATLVALLLHVPPVVPSVSVIVEPEQTAVIPEMGKGEAFMVTAMLLVHPARAEYVIVSAPGVTPVIVPAPGKTVAIPVLLLLHVPPVVASIKIVVAPVQAVVAPVITAGNELTVTIDVVWHPVGNL